MGAVAGLLPGLHADPVPNLPPSQSQSVSPADIVASRFQANAIAADSQGKGAEPQAVGFDLASASEVPTSLDPVYSPLPAPPPAVSGPKPVVVASAAPEPAVAVPAPEPAVAVPAPVKRVAPPAHPAAATSTVLNNTQIASIRDRLKLSPYQDQLWPPVESALRDINFHKDPKAKSAAKAATTIDADSAEVQRLKSAAVPLIMSFNSDQKQEVRTLLRLMGLENLATQF